MGHQALPTSSVLKIALGIFMLALSGCTSIFFQPTKSRYPYLELDRLSAKTVTLESKDQTKISAWIISSVDARKNHPEIAAAKNLKPSETRGLALQFHGNAENMTSHYRFQLWLLFEGWDVLTFDYRGYGMSEGKPGELRGTLEDGITAIEWANALAKERKQPLVIFGQSLGGNIALSALKETAPDHLRLLVIDSSFYSYRSIAREKLSEVWFFWPFQWLGWLLVSNEISASSRLEDAKRSNIFGAYETPAIFLHSENDPVVPSAQGLRLFDLYPGEKERWTTPEPGHVNTLFAEPTSDVPPLTPYREKMKLRLRDLKL